MKFHYLLFFSGAREIEVSPFSIAYAIPTPNHIDLEQRSKKKTFFFLVFKKN
jgi:hypothetical protein